MSMAITNGCPKCSGKHIMVTMWDGARSGGQTYKCLDCGYVEKHGCKMITYRGHDVVLRW